jgi:hypothetical protein
MLWAALATISGGLHLARYILMLVRKNVRVDIAFIAGGIAALLLVVCVWVTEVIIAQGLWRLSRNSSVAGKSYWFWRGVARFGIVYFPLTSGLYFLQGIEVLPTVLSAAQTGSAWLKTIAWCVLGLKVALVLAWWSYLDCAVHEGLNSRRRITAARALVLFVSVFAIIVVGVIGGTLRFLA